MDEVIHLQIEFNRKIENPKAVLNTFVLESWYDPVIY